MIMLPTLMSERWQEVREKNDLVRTYMSLPQIVCFTWQKVRITMTAEKAIEILSGFGIINRYCVEDAEALDMAIKALEKQPCEDCISRADVKKYLSAPDANGDRVIYESDLDLLPSVTPKANMGRWIDIQYFKSDDTYYRPKCPFCSIEPKEYSNYCPNCGAKMEESEDNKDE